MTEQEQNLADTKMRAEIAKLIVAKQNLFATYCRMTGVWTKQPWKLSANPRRSLNDLCIGIPTIWREGFAVPCCVPPDTRTRKVATCSPPHNPRIRSSKFFPRRYSDYLRAGSLEYFTDFNWVFEKWSILWSLWKNVQNISLMCGRGEPTDLGTSKTLWGSAQRRARS